MKFVFVKWGEDRKYAVFQELDSGRYVYVPFSRLIPTPVCEAYYKHVVNPNLLAMFCAEESSVFGIALTRHFIHLMFKYGDTCVREPEKEYMFPRTVSFECVRELISKGVDIDESIKRCS